MTKILQNITIFFAALALAATFGALQTVNAQTTIVNYDFNTASGCSAGTPATAANVTSTFTTSETTCTNSSGTATDASAFTPNTTAGSTIGYNNASANTTKYVQFQLSGSNLSSYTGYKVYFQSQRSNTGFTTITLQYSTDGTNFTSFGTTQTVSTAFATSTPEVFDLSTITALNGQSNVYFRLVTSGATATTGTVRIDNFQVQAASALPTVSTSVTTLPIFPVTSVNNPSAEQTYTVSGTNLSSAITVTAPTGYQVSLTTGTGFGSSVTTAAPTSGTIAATTIYVRVLSATAGAVAGGNITNASTGATTINVAVSSGNVIAAPVAFTTGNIVVERIGDTAVSSAATPVYLDEYTTSGTLVQTIVIPASANGANRRLLNSGTATTVGGMTRSNNGQYLVLFGIDAALNTAGVTSTTAATNNRIIGRVSSTGTVDTTTAISGGIPTATTRGVTTFDGSAFWFAVNTGVTGDPSPGIFYTTFGTTNATPTQLTTTEAQQPRIFNKQLYASSGITPANVSLIGTGLPTTTGQTSTPVVANSTGTPVSAPRQFFFADLNSTIPGVDTLYVADSNGLTKYTLGSTGGTWTATGNIAAAATTPQFGLTGSVSGNTVTLYGTSTTGNNVVSLADATGYNGTLTGAGNIIVTGTATRFLRGVTLAPTTAQPDLSITNVNVPSSSGSDRPLNYSITVSNTGGATASNVVVRLTLPSNVTFTGATSGGVAVTCTPTSGTIDCTLPSVAAGRPNSESDSFVDAIQAVQTLIVSTTPPAAGQTVNNSGLNVIVDPNNTITEIDKSNNSYSVGSTATPVNNTTITPPTAANITASGRVINAKGRAISRARVTVYDTTTGATRYARTSLNGGFTFNELPAGGYYVFSVNAKGYTFNQQGFQLFADREDLVLQSER